MPMKSPFSSLSKVAATLGSTEQGNVEKSRQRRSRHFAVLTYSVYAPRVKMAVALLDDFFEHSP